MPKCKECGGAGVKCQGIDEKKCLECPPDLAFIAERLITTGFGVSGVLDVAFHRNVELLLLRYQELIHALEPAEWQTPVERAKELRDNLVITMQIKEIVSRS